jgi:DNA-binding transcriptional LysR family regulator
MTDLNYAFLKSRKKPHPSIDELLTLYQVYQRLKAACEKGGTGREVPPASIADVARELNADPHTFYKRFRRLERQLEWPGPILKSRRGKGTEIPESADDLFRQIGEVLLAYQRIFKGNSETLVIRLGTTPALSVRVVPGLLQKFYESNQVLSGRHDISVQVIQDESYNLTALAPRTTTLDLVLTSCKPGVGQDDEHARAEFHRCLLCPLEHYLARKKPAIEKQGLSWDDLAKSVVVEFSDPNYMPGFPWNKLPAKREGKLSVRTHLEAHGHVLVNNAVAFSHREIMSEQEEEQITVIDLAMTPEVGTTPVVLLRPSGTNKRRSEEQRRVIDKLAQVISTFLNENDQRRVDARQLTEWFANYPFGYHTSQILTDDSPVDRWIRSAFEFECVPGDHVKGKHHMKSSDGRRRTFRIFGNLLKSENEHVHLLWRGTGTYPEHGAVSIVFTMKDLKARKSLVGAWLGISSWRAGCRPMSGAIVLHPQNDVPPSELRKLVERHAKAHGLLLPWPRVPTKFSAPPITDRKAFLE